MLDFLLLYRFRRPIIGNFIVGIGALFIRLLRFAYGFQVILNVLECGDVCLDVYFFDFDFMLEYPAFEYSIVVGMVVRFV